MNSPSTTYTNSKRASLFSRLRLLKEKNVSSESVQHLISSNLPPTDEERELVQRIIGDTQDRLSQLIKGAPSPSFKEFNHGNDTEVQIRQLEAQLHLHRALLSPLRSLPTELLSLIFTHCMSSFHESSWMRTHWHHLPSFRLSQVSVRWRAVALDTPSLWAILGDIRLNAKTASHPSKKRSYLSFVRTLLDRSKASDLWIYVYAPFIEYELHSHPVIDLLTEHSERWGVMTIESSCVTINAFGQAEKRVPRLRYVGLNIWRYQPSTSLKLFGVAPQLESVSITGISPPKLVFPYNQLKSYREGSVEGPSMLNGVSAVLKEACEKLVDLTLNGFIASTVSDMRTSKKVLLPKLKFLKLILEDEARHISGFIDMLQVPVLDQLLLSCSSRQVYSHIKRLISRSTPPDSPFPLRRLVVHVQERNDTAVEGLVLALRLLPDLQNLDLKYPTHEDLMPVVLELWKRHEPVLGQLKNFTIRYKFGDAKANQSILNTLARYLCDFRERRLVEGMATSTTTICIVFPNPESAVGAQAILNGWKREAASGASAHPPFDHWRTSLHSAIPELDGAQAPAKRKLDIAFPAKTDKLLRSMEDAMITAEDLIPLYISRLHISLLRLSEFRENHIPGDGKHKFRARALEIVKKWEPLIKEDVSKTGSSGSGSNKGGGGTEAELVPVKWAMKGDLSLVYISTGNAIRKSDEASRVIFGLEEDLHYTELDPLNK